MEVRRGQSLHPRLTSSVLTLELFWGDNTDTRPGLGDGSHGSCQCLFLRMGRGPFCILLPPVSSVVLSCEGCLFS